MDFEDYALAGLGTAGGLALGAKDIGQRIGHKWGEQGYYRSKAASLGNQSDAFVDYDREAEKIANSDLPQKLRLRELQKLKLKREQIVGKSVQNMETNAENSRGWNRGKGVVAGTLGTAAIGGALGLGYGLNNDFSNKRKTANFFSAELGLDYEALGIGAGGAIGFGGAGLLFKNKGYSLKEKQALQKYDNYSLRKSDNLPTLTDEEFSSDKYTPEYDTFKKSLENYRAKKSIDTIKADNEFREKNQQRASLGLGLVGATGLGLAGHYMQNGGSFGKNEKQVAKFSRKRNSTYVQFKQAYTQAVANFEYGAVSPEEFKGDLFGLGVGTLAGSEVGRAFAAKTKANALRRSADPNERHNQVLATQLEAAQQIQDPRQRARAIEKAQSQADYESAKIQRVARLKGFGQQALGAGLGVGAGYGGVLANTMANHWEQL